MIKNKQVSSYIDTFPEETKLKLALIRKEISKLVPDVIESMNYGIPSYKLDKYLFHFGGYEKHIGLYPGPKAIEHFKNELRDYKTSKGTIKISLDQDLPINLIVKMIKFNLK
jgi:uncharacterized protein YdhG (YjbR/CyaY superfamily)